LNKMSKIQIKMDNKIFFLGNQKIVNKKMGRICYL